MMRKKYAQQNASREYISQFDRNSAICRKLTDKWCAKRLQDVFMIFEFVNLCLPGVCINNQIIFNLLLLVQLVLGIAVFQGCGGR